MIDGEAMCVDELARKQHQNGHDFSNIHGLQVVCSPTTRGEHCPDDSLWREALKLELETRAARFHQAIDASIVFANDGVIRWLGDPIAKLAPGPDLLTPRTVILADACLPDGAREAVIARLELWIAATTRRLLGPLFALRNLQDGSEAVRGLAVKIAESLGVLEREAFRNQIKAFDQYSRAALRKHGVRFGAHYVYVHTLLRPAARALALQLWSLKTPDLDGEGLVNSLIPLALSGRTSLPVDPLISKDTYRVAGYRLCGDRVVRVDIVERLGDMIRAAAVLRSPSGTSRSTRPIFVVNGQMTSLAGCSGETFASILRSLGFESFEIARRELVFPRSVVEVQATSAPLPSAEAPENSTANYAPQSTSALTVDAPADPVFGEQMEEAGIFGAAVPASQEPDSRSDQSSDLGAEVSNSELNIASCVHATVIAWRPVRKPETDGEVRHFHRAKGRLPETDASKTGRGSGSTPSGDSEPEQDRLRRCVPRASTTTPLEAGPPPLRTPGGSESAQADEKRCQALGKRNASVGGAYFESQRKATVDQNSPFAKLLELRSILETHGKNES
jgi:ATP-dependent RNA helicase SUPV3L1/SUV3